MNCQQLEQHLDDYLDGTLSLEQEAGLHTHLDVCPACRLRVQQARAVQAGLTQVRVPPMSPGFAQRAIRRATAEAEPRPQRRAFVAGFGSAMAATLALVFVVVGLLPEQSLDNPSPEALPALAISLEIPQTVNLAFDVGHAVDAATLNINLPDNVEVIGFPGLRQLSWQTSLQQGRNILPLPLKGLAAAEGELSASIEQNGKSKTIRIKVKVEAHLPPQAESAGLNWV